MDWAAIISPVLTAALTVIATAIVTYLINKPKEVKQKREEQEQQTRDILALQSQTLQEIKTLKETSMRHETSITIEKTGLQALLRDRIYQLNRYCMGKGWASIEERQNFENMYQQYHKLGENGVMDSVRDLFFKLPEMEPNKE